MTVTDPDSSLAAIARRVRARNLEAAKTSGVTCWRCGAPAYVAACHNEPFSDAKCTRCDEWADLCGCPRESEESE